MPTFAYQARNQQGERISGTQEALDRQTALQSLRESGLFVTRLETAARHSRRAPEASVAMPAAVFPAPESTPESTSAYGAPAPQAEAVVPPLTPPHAAPRTPPRTPAGPTSQQAPAERQPFLHANAQQMSLYFQQMYAMLNAGTAISQALKVMGANAANAHLRHASAEMSQRTATGMPWSETMRAYPGLFSELMIGMIQAGERGGFLDRMCLRLSEYSERDYQIQQTIKRETWYPKLLVFLSFLIPSVVVLVLHGFGAWLRAVIPPLVAIGCVFAVWKLLNFLAPSVLHGGPLRHTVDLIKLSIPIAGKTARSLATAKFCRSLGALNAAGMGVGEQIELSARACGNVVIGERARSVLPQIEQGATITSALASTNQFPPVAVQMLYAGEESGQIDEQLEKVANFLEADAETTIKQTVIAFTILTFLAIAVYIGLQVVSFYLNMYGGVVDMAESG